MVAHDAMGSVHTKGSTYIREVDSTLNLFCNTVRYFKNAQRVTSNMLDRTLETAAENKKKIVQANLLFAHVDTSAASTCTDAIFFFFFFFMLGLPGSLLAYR